MVLKIFLVSILGCVIAITGFAQKLPVNFEYKRETGQESGVPYFILTPRTEAMSYDAARGSTFEALGALAQPEKDKYGLIFYNAKDSYQLHLQKEKGVLIRIDGEEYKVADYTLGEQSKIGRLKLEAATIGVNGSLFWKIVNASDVFIKVGLVSYSLDGDNVEAMHYYAAEIKKDIARRRAK